jgi:hypothetical protein
MPDRDEPENREQQPLEAEETRVEPPATRDREPAEAGEAPAPEPQTVSRPDPAREEPTGLAPTSSGSKSGSSWKWPLILLALALGAALIIGAIGWTLYNLTFRGPVDAVDNVSEVAVERARDVYGLMKEVAGDVKRQMQFTPRVTVGNEVIIEESSPIKELATYEENFTHTHVWEHEWLRSTKRIELRGTFTAKAGFDLEKAPVTLATDEEGREVDLVLPEPEVLSVEGRNIKILEDKDGLWNRITDQDRQRAMNALLDSAREHAQENGAPERARQAIIDEVREAVANQEDLRLRTPAEREVPGIEEISTPTAPPEIAVEHHAPAE